MGQVVKEGVRAGVASGRDGHFLSGVPVTTSASSRLVSLLQLSS